MRSCGQGVCTIVFGRVVFYALVDAQNHSHEREAGCIDHRDAVQQSLGVQGGELSTENCDGAHESNEKPELVVDCTWVSQLIHSLRLLKSVFVLLLLWLLTLATPTYSMDEL